MAAKVRQYKLPSTLDMWEHVSVLWEDAYAIHGAVNSEQFIKNYGACMRRSTGYVIHYDDIHLFIAGTDDRESGQEHDCEDVTVVLVSMIRRITRSKK